MHQYKGSFRCDVKNDLYISPCLSYQTPYILPSHQLKCVKIRVGKKEYPSTFRYNHCSSLGNASECLENASSMVDIQDKAH